LGDPRRRTDMPSVVKKPAFSEITLQNGEKFKVVETFSTVLRHQKEALVSDEEPVISLMGPEGTRIAVDPVEIISVTELKRPTRNYGKSRRNGGKKIAKPEAGEKTPAAKRLAQRRQKTAAARKTRRKVTA
jgi:hypothetical protein